MSARITKIEEKVLRLVTLFYALGYVLLIAPPRAINLTVSQRKQNGELSRQPLYVVMLVELLIRVALVLLIAVGLESIFGDTTYETYNIDTMFIIIVILGTCHSVLYYFLLGYLRKYIGLRVGMRIYRLVRNLCYAGIPGFLVVVPLLIWEWKQDYFPFDDGLVFQVYCFTTLLMITVGVIEAFVMKRNPRGLDKDLFEE